MTSTALLTTEEARADHPAAVAMVEGAGFAPRVRGFATDLARVASPDEAQQVVTSHGRQLWRFAVDRAQARVVAGHLPASDDRPLYWARLAMIRQLREWSRSYAARVDQPDELISILDRTSRGHLDVVFGARESARRLLVSGFDPFGLGQHIGKSNPSGAASLTLHGTTLHTSNGTVVVQAMIFPVRWRDFTRGIVEQAFAAHLPHVDGFATISQGQPGAFDLEVFNGSFRVGSPDNEDSLGSTGPIPIVGSDEPPEWTRTTLPVDNMARGSLPYPVRVNTAVTAEVDGELEIMIDGPLLGARARAGGGGTYLSNEIAYRVTLLRDSLGLDLPGGHIHTPVLVGLGPDEVTNSAFEANRDDIVRQTRALLAAAAEQL